MLSAEHTAVQQHVALCVSSVAHRYFARGQPVVMSTPSSVRDVTEHELLPRSNEIQLANEMLENLHKESEWPLLSCKLDKPMTDSDNAHKHQSYIITLWPNRDDDVLDSLQQQIDNLLSFVNSFNHRAIFLLVVMDYSIKVPQVHALKMAETLWNPYKIINVLIIFPNINRLAYDTINLYTWFPYDAGHCGQVRKVDLLDQWVLNGNGSFRSNTDLFPVKVPRNLHGCPLVVAPVERIPFVQQTTSRTDSQGDVTYMFEGLEIEYLLILAKAINFTPVFLQRRVGDFVQVRLEIFMEIAQGSVDITVGTHPLLPLLVRAGDPVRPYYELTMRWWVPCATPAPRMDKIMAVFTPSVWVSIFLVFILTAVAFWRTAVGPHSVYQTDSKIFKNFHYSFYNVWAIFLGVSMPELPKTLRLRSIFLLYVWYSFAMSTVFQVFFISFLVNPGYTKRVESFEELVNSGLKLATDARMLSLANTSGYWEYLRLGLSTDSCFIIDECLIQLVRHKNITTVSSDFQFEYVLATIGRTKDKNKYVCTIPEIVVTSRFVMYVSKGNPLLDRFNLWIQRAIESGLVKKYWSEFIWNVTLQGVPTSEQDQSEGIQTGGDMFFVFTLSHLSAAFCQLLICYLFCFAVFMAECRI
jgi:hypothetical protein